VIVHIILFSPRSDLSNDARRDLLDTLAAAAEGIPAVRRFRVGRRVTHGLPGYEQMMVDDYAFAAVVEVEHLDGLKAYLTHPAHIAIGRHFSASASRSLAYDYNMVEARDSARLVPD
jgi:stress responsive alpha/beta barrel protein